MLRLCGCRRCGEVRSIGELCVALVDVCCSSRWWYIPCRYLAVVGGVPFLVESNLQIHQRRCVKTISRRCGCLAASRAASGMGFRGAGRGPIRQPAFRRREKTAGGTSRLWLTTSETIGTAWWEVRRVSVLSELSSMVSTCYSSETRPKISGCRLPSGIAEASH